MTSRQAGRRIAVMTAAQRKRPARRGGTRQAARRKDEPLRPRERRQLIQLVVCGSIFVLLVAAKLLLPDRMAQINERLTAAMERNMDVQAVFSAVGRAFAGEDDAGGTADQVYQAVFRHSEGEEALMTEIQIPAAQDTAALEALQFHRRQLEPQTEEGADALPTQEVSALAYVLYSDQNLPEDASMEQALLGFDYCSPVSGAISSEFGYREHPMEGEERFHYGVDLAADIGAAVACFADGTVTAVGESSSYGKYCIVAHEGGCSTLYAHCSKITAVSGATVEMGQKIAEVGQTGMATGPHLHFELQRDGVYLNPVYYVSGA